MIYFGEGLTAPALEAQISPSTPSVHRSPLTFVLMPIHTSAAESEHDSMPTGAAGRSTAQRRQNWRLSERQMDLLSTSARGMYEESPWAIKSCVRGSLENVQHNRFTNQGLRSQNMSNLINLTDAPQPPLHEHAKKTSMSNYYMEAYHHQADTTSTWIKPHIQDRKRHVPLPTNLCEALRTNCVDQLLVFDTTSTLLSDSMGLNTSVSRRYSLNSSMDCLTTRNQTNNAKEDNIAYKYLKLGSSQTSCNSFRSTPHVGAFEKKSSVRSSLSSLSPLPFSSLERSSSSTEPHLVLSVNTSQPLPSLETSPHVSKEEIALSAIPEPAFKRVSLPHSLSRKKINNRHSQPDATSTSIGSLSSSFVIAPNALFEVHMADIKQYVEEDLEGMTHLSY
ncbi:hypothetical protein BCR41DRAFT_401794 [Lobosporangium transversale]|uniref:Uncharacterized protein n=1 Tax=Lobosporangium transversale TaxID=64571 RepID=A0A1Y2G886_9FUNG|nr:hypothetical protein BCR41DRAFT_401794 [Lobosporangium transversale]ORY99521.1 hypothetical protein BCR41DRAFT_401794 [Lobosporangium transversale]|eukprot:XP_021875847.1 hypothetical protein BCR41DRAFT_401794 [Lobosporangium transversale]